MLSGPPGTGKRALAGWLAGRYLLGGGAAGPPSHPSRPLVHPDLVWIRPEEGKSAISVDQIRALVADLGLKSHAGGGKAAVIEPADAMTLNAANSLLKTLEEPPGDALIVLVADSLSRMPATVLSRCALLRVPVPAQAEALAWLSDAAETDDAAGALALAGGSPLRALALLSEGMTDFAETLHEDLGRVIEGSLVPLEAAARWGKKDPRFAMEWLRRLVQALIRRRIGADRASLPGPVPESVLQRMDSQNLFCYLDRLTGLLNQPAGSFNELVALESLLIPWARGLDGAAGETEPRPLGVR